ncbi:MAG: GNAT family N-acetyltransferase [Pseudomonadales bacterium]|nr:GNAT family N-acetyltransferase [Pseudomonadales bacterium]
MSVEIRDAHVTDIPHLAYVSMQASGGIYEAIYEGAIPDRETHLIIEHIFSRLDATSSFRNCRILESDGKVIGGLHGHAVAASANDPGDALIRRDRLYLVAPFAELHAPSDSYYISSVALYPENRGGGHGRRLMQDAENIARSMDLAKMSLHVFAENRGAVSLYESLGYEEIQRRPAVSHPLIRYEGDRTEIILKA